MSESVFYVEVKWLVGIYVSAFIYKSVISWWLVSKAKEIRIEIKEQKTKNETKVKYIKGTNKEQEDLKFKVTGD